MTHEDWYLLLNVFYLGLMSGLGIGYVTVMMVLRKAKRKIPPYREGELDEFQRQGKVWRNVPDNWAREIRGDSTDESNKPTTKNQDQ